MVTQVRPEDEVVSIEIEKLFPSDSPRLAGFDADHAKVLAESEEKLPPITVQRGTMRVIDGMHRLQAAVLRGDRTIDVRLYDGDDKDAFVFAVKANTTHGLPLSLADRTAAAVRIMASHPQWSNAVIATATGLSTGTIAAIRGRSTQQDAESNTRIGLDGRVRPLNSAAARTIASELMRHNPGASVREIARAANISTSTAWDVRRRLREGDDPVPPKQRPAGKRDRRPRAGAARNVDPENVLQNLRQDPSLRSNEAGRALLRWLHSHTININEWQRMIDVDKLPPHCVDVIAELAGANAEAWGEFARQLQRDMDAVS